MSNRFGLILLLLFSLLLSGCCTCVGFCNRECYTPPCELLKCCPVKRDHTYDCCYFRCHRPFCPRICPGGCTKQAKMNQLACEGVQVVELGNRVNIILYTDNCFEQGTANMDQSCYNTMDHISDLINAYGDICPPIKINGHTDNIGDVCCKWPLSRQLADSVAAYLWTHGVPLPMLCTGGCACTHSIASMRTVCGNAFNRRVEITFWRKGLRPYWEQVP